MDWILCEGECVSGVSQHAKRRFSTASWMPGSKGDSVQWLLCTAILHKQQNALRHPENTEHVVALLLLLLCALQVGYKVAQGEYWRLLSAAFVHFNVLHAGVRQSPWAATTMSCLLVWHLLPLAAASTSSRLSRAGQRVSASHACLQQHCDQQHLHTNKACSMLHRGLLDRYAEISLHACALNSADQHVGPVEHWPHG